MYEPPTPQWWSPKHLDTSLPGSSSPLHFLGFTMSMSQRTEVSASPQEMYICPRLFLALHGHRQLPGKAVTSVVLSQWRIRGGTCTLGDKLPTITALSMPVHQTPVLARTLIKALLHCALSLLWFGQWAYFSHCPHHLSWISTSYSY